MDGARFRRFNYMSVYPSLLLDFRLMAYQSYDFLLTADGSSVTEDLNPTSKKLMPVSDGYILHNVSGIRAHVVSRMDGKGYDITKCE